MSLSTLTDDLIAAFLEGRVAAEALPAPVWGPIGAEVYERTYSRPIFELDPDQPTDPVTGAPRFVLDDSGRRVPQKWWSRSWPLPEDGSGRSSEVFGETVRRVVLGNLRYVPSSSHLPGEAVQAFRAMYQMEMLPAGRHLWAAGVVPSVRNCFRAGWSARLADHFEFLACRLFEGGGVGSNYSDDYLARTAPISALVLPTFFVADEHPDAGAVRAAAGQWMADRPLAGEGEELEVLLHVVEDSREGWVDAWALLFDLATTRTRSARVVFDVSNIRRYGAVLKTFGGTASGPAPFVSAALTIARVLCGAYGRRIGSLEAMECDHAIAGAVCAGGTRRSARMAMKRWSDPEIFDFISCKADHLSHWSTNISVEIDDAFFAALDGGDLHAHDVLRAVTRQMLSNGEPGLYNSSLAGRFELGDVRCSNPCGEVPLSEDPETAAGESCNIGSVNLSGLGGNFDRAVELFGLMARFLYRATFTPIAHEGQRALEAANRRIGVGFMGLQEWCVSQGFKLSDLPLHDDALQHLVSFRAMCRQSADRLADALGTPRPVKVTAIAPTGTIAQMPGAQPSFEPILSRYFIRRVRYQANDPKLIGLAADGYRIVDDICSANTKVVEFPAKHALLDRVADVSLVEQADEVPFESFLELQAAVTEAFCGGRDGNAVSATANLPALSVDDEVVEHFVSIVRAMMPRLKGLTAFPAVSRPLSPIEAVSKETFEQLRDALFDAQLASLAGDSNDGSCATGACPVK